jgi:hypothetical protein
MKCEILYRWRIPYSAAFSDASLGDRFFSSVAAIFDYDVPSGSRKYPRAEGAT